MGMFLAATGGAGETINGGTLALTILITGIVVVFLVLIFLTLIIKLYGNIVYNLTNKMKKGKEAKQEAAPKVSAPVSKPVPAAPAVEEGIPGEVIAAIAAAVYCTEGVPFSAVKSIRRSRRAGGTRSAWGMAGILENTRPF